MTGILMTVMGKSLYYDDRRTHGIRKLEQEKVGDIETSKPATCFPTASAIACSWNPAIVKKMGEAIAKRSKKRADIHCVRLWNQYQAFSFMRKKF